MKIEILGPGCYNCVKLETLIDEVAEQRGAPKFEIERVNDEKRVLQYMPLDEIPACFLTASWSAHVRFPRARGLYNGFLAFLSPPTTNRQLRTVSNRCTFRNLAAEICRLGTFKILNGAGPS